MERGLRGKVRGGVRVRGGQWVSGGGGGEAMKGWMEAVSEAGQRRSCGVVRKERKYAAL